MSKYATLDIDEAFSFTEISKEIEKSGHKLTPARTRVIVMQCLEKIVRKVSKEYGKPLSRQVAKDIVKEPDFQNIIAPFIQKACET